MPILTPGLLLHVHTFLKESESKKDRYSISKISRRNIAGFILGLQMKSPNIDSSHKTEYCTYSDVS